jgi:hypothetical protein
LNKLFQTQRFHTGGCRHARRIWRPTLHKLNSHDFTSAGRLVRAHDTGDADSNRKAMHSRGGGGAQFTTTRGRVGPARKGGSSGGPVGATRSDAVQRGRVAPTRGLYERRGPVWCSKEGWLQRGACRGDEVRRGASRKGGYGEVRHRRELAVM